MRFASDPEALRQVRLLENERVSAHLEVATQAAIQAMGVDHVNWHLESHGGQANPPLGKSELRRRGAMTTVPLRTPPTARGVSYDLYECCFERGRLHSSACPGSDSTRDEAQTTPCIDEATSCAKMLLPKVRDAWRRVQIGDAGTPFPHHAAGHKTDDPWWRPTPRAVRPYQLGRRPRAAPHAALAERRWAACPMAEKGGERVWKRSGGQRYWAPGAGRRASRGSWRSKLRPRRTLVLPAPMFAKQPMPRISGRPMVHNFAQLRASGAHSERTTRAPDSWSCCAACFPTPLACTSTTCAQAPGQGIRLVPA